MSDGRTGHGEDPGTMNVGHAAALLLLAAIWGASFLFIRVAAPVLGAFPFMAARVLLAAGALWLFARVRRTPLEVRRYWRQLLLLGLVHAAAPYVLLAWAELRLSASMAAVLVAASPLFTTAIGRVWLHQPGSSRQTVGLVLGIIGVAVLVGWSPVALDGAGMLSVGATLAAAACYAVGALYARRHLANVPAPTLAFGQQLGAAAWLIVPAVLTLPRAAVSGVAIGSLFALALLCTALAYVLFFRLNAAIGPVKTSTVTYVIPVFGVLWGTLFLDEHPTVGTFAGLACIMASMLLVNRRATRKARARPPTADAAMTRSA